MPSRTDRYEAACAAIDRANAEDPRRAAAEGREHPHELLYSMRMVEWAGRLRPDASEELLLAVRAQHVCRWKTPRANYPEGRAGYLRWREDLKKFHAGMAADILKAAGYDPAPIEKVRQLILRKNFAPDPEGQALEDAACLVFLEHELGEFAAKHPEEKVVEILLKTWEKMSPRARELSGAIACSPASRALLARALSRS